jgi:hypothetical protein
MTVNKVRRNGSYAPLSAHYYKDDAIDEAGEAAELLYVRGLAFCADVLSDGFISDRQLVRFVGVGMFDATDRAAALVKAGLWEREDGGYRVKSWLKWNRSKSEIADAMAKDSQRKGSSAASGPSRPTPPEPPNGGGQDIDRTPAGFRTESETTPVGSPNGVQPHAGARAGTPRHSTPRHSTTDPNQENLLADADAPTDITPKPMDRFEEFWALWPKKVKRKPSQESWERHVAKTKTPVDFVLTALRAQIVAWQTDPRFPQFVPDPTTWINQHRWQDETQTAYVAAVSGDSYRSNQRGPYRNPTNPDAYDDDLL